MWSTDFFFIALQWCGFWILQVFAGDSRWYPPKSAPGDPDLCNQGGVRLLRPPEDVQQYAAAGSLPAQHYRGAGHRGHPVLLRRAVTVSRVLVLSSISKFSLYVYRKYQCQVNRDLQALLAV